MANIDGLPYITPALSMTIVSRSGDGIARHDHCLFSPLLPFLFFRDQSSIFHNGYIGPFWNNRFVSISHCTWYLNRHFGSTFATLFAETEPRYTSCRPSKKSRPVFDTDIIHNGMADWTVEPQDYTYAELRVHVSSVGPLVT